MAFTQTDLDNVEAAILSLATGERITQVTINDKTIRYDNPDTAYQALKDLRSIIQEDLGLWATRVYAKNGGRC